MMDNGKIDGADDFRKILKKKKYRKINVGKKRRENNDNGYMQYIKFNEYCNRIS